MTNQVHHKIYAPKGTPCCGRNLSILIPLSQITWAWRWCTGCGKEWHVTVTRVEVPESTEKVYSWNIERRPDARDRFMPAMREART